MFIEEYEYGKMGRIHFLTRMAMAGSMAPNSQNGVFLGFDGRNQDGWPPNQSDFGKMMAEIEVDWSKIPKKCKILGTNVQNIGIFEKKIDFHPRSSDQMCKILATKVQNIGFFEKNRLDSPKFLKILY